MKPIRCDLSQDLEQIKILSLSDIHIGDINCDFKLLQSRLDYIKSDPECYCILSGDLMNTATRSSKSDIYSELIPPKEQLERCVDIFGEIKDKILCIVPGNHELRTYKSEGIDMTAIMAAQLGISDKYSDTTALLFIRFGKAARAKHSGKGKRPLCYSAYVTHGGGGGRKEGGKVNRLADLASIVDADIYIHSHTHLPVIMKQAFFRTDTRNSTVALVDKLFVNTGAHLDYGGYGDIQSYKPSSKTTPIICLSGTHKRMTATL